jgi:hypothetical protein
MIDMELKPILIIGYPNDRVRGKIRELKNKLNLPLSIFRNVGLDHYKVMGMRDAYFVDTGCGNVDQDERYMRIKEYIAIFNLKEFKEASIGGKEGGWGDEGFTCNPSHFRPLPDNRLAEVCQVLLEGINNCIEENLHLADGDNCTLIDLKKALRKAEEIASKQVKQ